MRSRNWNRELIPRRRIPGFAISNNFFDIGCKIEIEDWYFTRFFFVFTRERDTLRDSTTRRNGRRHHSDRESAVFDDDFVSRRYAGHDTCEIPCRLGIRHVNDRHTTMIPRLPLSGAPKMLRLRLSEKSAGNSGKCGAANTRIRQRNR